MVLHWDRSKQDELSACIDRLDQAGGIVRPQSFREIGLVADDYPEFAAWLLQEQENLKSNTEVNVKLRQLFYMRWALWHQAAGIEHGLIKAELGMISSEIFIH